jgi:hypothetical protein
MRFFRSALTGILFLIIGASLAFADPILNPVSGSLDATAVLSSGTIQLDVRGLLEFDFTDPTVGIPDVSLVFADSTGGTDPSGLVLPFGNAFLNVTSPASASTGVTDIAYFDFGSVTFNGPTLTIPAYFASVPLGDLPDAALADLVANSGIPFNFTFSTSQDFGNGNAIAQFTLTSVSQVPEPATVGLALAGIFALTGYRFRVARRSVRARVG